ncbi:endonuclease III [uncultured Gilliamella sp.]|uniref:endonuclease III n=1 Tax=uncultured Gilliamella sp. TaxID=1193505 RepID=UPI0025E08F30|nr:endonuclease III [uncultured Gilliamella sp.]
MKQATRIQILARLKDHIKDPTTELIYTTPFELLIAVVLSAQATDVSVNKATKLLFTIANTAEQILDLGVDKLKNYIRTIGLYNSKAVNIIKTCQILVDKYQGEVPENFESLIELPGVGRKTANVVLNTAFGWPTIAVDTHIFRVCNRTGFASGKTVEDVEKKLLKVVPYEYKLNCHHWLILHGRYTCIARKPRCGACVIEDLCEYKAKIYPE